MGHGGQLDHEAPVLYVSEPAKSRTKGKSAAGPWLKRYRHRGLNYPRQPVLVWKMAFPKNEPRNTRRTEQFHAASLAR